MRRLAKVAVVTNIIPDYRFPIFASLIDEGAFEWRVFVTMPLEQSCERARKFLPLTHSRAHHLWLSTKHRTSGGLQRELLPIPLGLLGHLWDYRPDVIVAGEFGLRSLLCWVAAQVLRARFVLWSEEIASSAEGRSRIQQMLRRFFVKQADAFLPWGTPAEEYLAIIGADKKSVFKCAQAIDNECWLRCAQTVNRDLVRRKLELKGTVFLLVGRVVPRKGFRNFIEAWGRLQPGVHAGVTAVIVGDGEQLPELRELAAARRLTNLRFVGAQSQSELARYYAAADIFVFPSLEDVWGLVINEAMCFGLPILASRYAGASQELIATPEVGRAFNPADIDEFAAHLHSWAESPPPRALRRCHEIIKQHNFDRSIDAIRRMLEHLDTGRGARPAAEPMSN